MCEDRRTQTPTEEDSGSGDEKPSVAGRQAGVQDTQSYNRIRHHRRYGALGNRARDAGEELDEMMATAADDGVDEATAGERIFFC